MANDVWDLIADVEAARVRVVAAVTGISGADGDWKPDAETWSVAENVEHLVLAEYSGINRMWRAVEAHQRGEAPGDAPNRGLSIETIIERTWKPRELALPMAAPQFGADGRATADFVFAVLYGPACGVDRTDQTDSALRASLDLGPVGTPIGQRSAVPGRFPIGRLALSR